MSKREDDWFTCPVCGEVVRAEALACPACGADEDTGWSEDSAYDGVDLPDEVFGEQTRETRQRSPLFGAVALLLVVLILLLVLMGVW